MFTKTKLLLAFSYLLASGIGWLVLLFASFGTRNGLLITLALLGLLGTIPVFSFFWVKSQAGARIGGRIGNGIESVVVGFHGKIASAIAAIRSLVGKDDATEQVNSVVTPPPAG